MSRAIAFALLALAPSCSRRTGEPAPPPTRAPEIAPTTPPTAGDLPTDWRLPLGWRWLSSLEAGFTVAYPGLPTVETPAPGAQRLVSHTERGEFAVGAAPVRDPADLYRRQILAQGWTIEGDRLLAGNVRALDVSNGTLITHTRLVPGAIHTFVLTATSRVGDDGDANTFLESFAPSTRLESRPLHFAPGGFSIVAPARMSGWEERSADPPIRGYAGLVDGAQVAAAFADVGAAALANGPNAFLQRGVASSIVQLGGTTLSRSDAPFRGYPSIRIEHRGADGVYVTRRVVLVGTRYYDASVYAPGGVEPAWAGAFVDSLAFDP